MNKEKKLWSWFVGKLKRKGDEELFVCNRCKKQIEKEQSFVIVRGDIIMYDSNIKAAMYTCPEQAFNYAQRLVLHSVCWIDLLKEYGVSLYDMGEVAEQYKQRGKKDKIK